MPGSGEKGRKANKPNLLNTPSSSPGLAYNPNAESFHLSHIDDNEEWKVLISGICQLFSLPDLQSRSGLKKVHGNISTIYPRMDRLFQLSQHRIRVRGAIVGIFAKMCIDSLLRNKLLEEGLLAKIIPLTQEDETRHLALCALNTVTHHGGVHARMEVAKYSNVITKLIDDLPNDIVVAELGIAILAHGLLAVVEGKPAILKTIDMVKVLKSVLEALNRFYTQCIPIIDYALQIFTLTSLHASEAFKSYPPSLSYLAAGLRSKDWACRSACLNGFIRVFQPESEPDLNYFDVIRLTGIFGTSTFPRHLDQILKSYGLQRSTIFLGIMCTFESQKAILDYAKSRERNLYALGLKQAPLITKTEYSLADASFRIQDSVTGNFLDDDLDGMPFREWRDSLKHEAKAIREKQKPDEVYLADILDLKYLIVQHVSEEELMDFAKKALERNPEQAYFYYALSLTSDDVQGLRASKKGLKCKHITPYIRHQLLQRAVDHAADLGIKVLQSRPASANKQWEEGIAFIKSAIEDAKTYLKEAPPDSRHTRNVGQWLFLLTLLANPDINPNLKELEETLKRVAIADEFCALMSGNPPPKTYIRLAQKALAEHYPLGAAQFSPIFAHFDKLKMTIPSAPNPVKPNSDIAVWLEDMTEDDYINDVVKDCSISFKRSLSVNDGVISLYRCSWCGNPSAALRKCSGCSASRYCDSACQKSDWKEHKKTCGQN